MPTNNTVLPLRMLLFCFHSANTIIVSFLPIYLKYKGLDGEQIGLLLAVGPFAALISQPIWGYLSDKYHSVKRSLLICLIGLLISSCLFFNMNTFVTLILFAVAFYFFTSPISGLGDSLSQRKSAELNISFGSIRMWGSIGFATSSLLIGQLLGKIGVQYMLFPYLFYGSLAFIVCFFLPDVKGEGTSIRIRDIWRLLKNIPFLTFLLLVVFVTITHRANDSFISLYLTELGGGEGLIGWAWFVGVASEATVFALGTLWFRRFHELFFISAAALLYSIRWFIYSLVGSPLIIVGLQVMHGICFGIFYLASFSYVTKLIPKDLQSTGHLFFFSVYFGFSGIVGSLFGGAIIDTQGGDLLYFCLGWMALLGSIGLFMYYLMVRRRSKLPIESPHTSA
ncbi:PPP family 3-phenylpropionic acid transporter [Pullulanibacillus pueri]|uniref:3-phenylpropionic acid transporter n=1 Tax=Pullulanibacillus pueri TaxID=1437324 RepID=A0A8J3EMD5_9BACL|nr:MFS transporter [Pullulanibacillus pueri]MBM7682900.1 PPP family 3-phenylpropionic acid transporter [Pullulanibacillus pueri]GGH84430.1 3-phenylpropionic acid transporter [Pullulanibacillus pueri]